MTWGTNMWDPKWMGNLGMNGIAKTLNGTLLTGTLSMWDNTKYFKQGWQQMSSFCDEVSCWNAFNGRS